tara:strand:+ start:712 stop:960 length:249 start_codon:yes stop_codon:yes gene_type:complete
MAIEKHKQIEELQKIYNSMTNSDLKLFLEWFVKDRLTVFNWKDLTTVKVDDVQYSNGNIRLMINDTPEHNEKSRGHNTENEY